MVIDNIKNAKLYLGLSENFKKAFDFISKCDVNALALGKTEVDGDNVYIKVSEYDTKLELPTFEAHREYADIQYILSGEERSDWAEIDSCTEAIPYNKEKDMIRLNSEVFDTNILRAGDFAIYFPTDAHRPSLSVSGQKKVKKLLVKVKI